MATPYPTKSGSGLTEHLPSSRLTAERARRLLSYDPETGALTWKVSNRTVKAGDVAGTVHPDHATSYRRVQIDGKRYRAHRLCFLIYYGAWPSGEIDHMDQNGLNNRIENLRAVPPGVNARNQRKHSTNTSGVTGVFWLRSSRKWMAYIYDVGERVYLGTFDSPGEAAYARKLAERGLGYHPNHGSLMGRVSILWRTHQ